MTRVRNLWPTLGSLLVCFIASTAFASAGITVNKAFAPNSIALGATSVVTVTLQNDSTSSAAAITAFSDDIGTTMAGHASLLSSPAPTTTCSGGTPTVAGQVLSMNGGAIPIAPSVSTPGSCTITFSVAGAVSGNGFNTISAANVVTSLGSPGADVTQTLNVQSANVTATASSTGTVQTGDTNTVTFVVTNPAAVPLTNVAFPITSSASLAYTVSGYTTSCGGTATLPTALGTTGTTSFSGLTIPASGTCTVTLSVTSPNSTTATFTLNTGAVSDTQGATNGTFVATTAAFKTGRPTISKSFSPSALIAGGTTTLTLNIANGLTVKPLSNAAISDTLPGSLTISGAPTANANCGSPTLGGTGTGTLTFSGGTIAANGTCAITATVSVPSGQAAGTLTNSVPAANFTSNEVALASAAATANLVVTAAGGGLTTSQSVAPASANVGVAMKITLNFVSVGAALTAGSFSDVLPQTVQPMVALTDAGHSPTFSGCGSNSPAVAFGGTGGNTTVSGSNLTLTSGGTCSVGFWVAFTTATSTTQNDTNTLSAANVSFSGSAGTVQPAANSTVVLTQVPTFSINNYLVSNSGLAGQPLTVNATLYDSTGTADTNAVMVVNLTAGKIQLAPTPNFTFAGCPAGFSAANIAINGAREQFTATLGSINATCSIGYDVVNETGITGTFAPANSTYKSTLTGGTAIASTATNNVTFATTTINLTKAFSPNQIQSGGNSTADITLTVPQAGALALTQANGVAFSDALPANVTFSPTPNVTFTGCGKAGQPAPAFTISGTTLAISNLTLVTTNATQTACDVKFDVTSSVVGAPLNQIAASAVTSASGITNTQNALASLTVNSGLGIAKTFLNPTLQIGGTDYVRFLVTNSASSAALGGGTIVDAMPATLVLASTALGTIQAGDPALCGGSVAGPIGTGTLNLSGLAVAGLTSPTAPGQCVVYVQVKASASAAPGSVGNTIAAGGLNIGGYINQVAATGSVTLTAAANAAVSKTFAPALVLRGAASVLSIVIDDTAVGAAALNGMALTDTLPAGVQIAATPNASTSCGAGSVTAVAASASVALTSGSVAANATCTITVSVTGTTGGAFTNTIAANALTTTQGATNAAAATATLTVAAITLSKAFLPATIPAGGSSALTITIPNGTTALTGIALTDTLPTGLTIAATPNAATTCPSGAVAATPGGTSVALTAGTLAASTTCTLTVNVTGATAAIYINTIPANALHTAQTITNPVAATAGLTVGLASIVLTKAFVPATIVAGSTSLLTITIPNTIPGAVSLASVGLTDTLPSGVTIAATPNAATTCAGSLTAVAGSASVALAGGALAVNATCTISVNVTGTAAGSFTNTIGPSALTTTQGVTNATAATAPFTVTPDGLTLSKAFVPAAIVAGAIATLTIAIPNTAPGAVALSAMTLTDTLPTGVTIAATPNATTTCPAGTVTAAAGGTNVALLGGTLAANATCTIVVHVTGAAVGSYVNTIATHALSTAESVSNQSPATATLDITAVPDVTLAKTFSPATVLQGATSLLTVALSNTATASVPLGGLAFSDAYPAGLVNAATPAAATTCPAGSVTAVAGTATLALAGATLAANASCTVTVNVDAPIGTYSNTVTSLTTTQGATNVAAATAGLTVTAASTPTITNSYAPASISTGGIATLTISLANTGTNAVALGNVALTDTLLAGVTIAPAPNAATTCPAGVATGNAGGATLTLGGASLAAGATCTLSVDVTSATVGAHVNTIAANALSDTQLISNAAPASTTLTVSAAPAVALTQVFAPPAIVAGATSVLTLSFANTAGAAVALTGLSLSDALPAGLALAAIPSASTTCPSGTLAAVAGAASFALSAATLGANATCTMSVTVTASAAGAFANALAAGTLTSAQGATNAASQALLTVTAAPQLGLTQAFAPATIVAGTTSVLTLVVANTAAGAVALGGMGLTDTLPAGLVLAVTPHASTTCAGGTVAAIAGAASFALSAATLAANASCTIVLTVAASSAGTYTNSIAAAAITDTQRVTNAAVAATLTVTAAASLRLTKTSDVAGAGVAAGQTVAYTVAIVNPGTTVVTGAKLTDVLANGSLVAGSVTVDGVGAADAVGKAGAPFGSIAAGKTVTIHYRVVVAANAASGVQLTNSATAGSDQGCAGAACSGAALPDAVSSPPKVDVKLSIDGKLSETVTLGQVVTYSAIVTNVGGSTAQNVTLRDTLPAGVTPIAGSLTVTANASSSDSAGARSQASARAGSDRGAATMTTDGQTVAASLGTLAAGASATVAFRATITLPITTVAQNIVTIGATGIASTVTSNPVLARMVKAQLTVTKSASAVVAQIGDRVDYVVHVALPGALAFGKTTIVDRLPDYLLFAPGSARINGIANVPAVSGHTLTWTLPTLGAAATLTYATSIAAGAPANATLDNLVSVNAVAAGGGPSASGSASATIAIASSTFGTCYPITGRVYDDAQHSGRFEKGDVGLGGVSLVLDDGESVVTDSYGRYNFPCVRQGMHALRLDEQTLPSGSAAYLDRAIDSERSTRRLVHGIFDDTILQDVNFAIGQAK